MFGDLGKRSGVCGARSEDSTAVRGGTHPETSIVGSRVMRPARITCVLGKLCRFPFPGRKRTNHLKKPSSHPNLSLGAVPCATNTYLSATDVFGTSPPSHLCRFAALSSPTEAPIPFSYWRKKVVCAEGHPLTGSGRRNKEKRDYVYHLPCFGDDCPD